MFQTKPASATICWTTWDEQVQSNHIAKFWLQVILVLKKLQLERKPWSIVSVPQF